MMYVIVKDARGPVWKAVEGVLVPGRGLEPPRSYPLVPETSASTNSATRAGEEGRAMYARVQGLSIEGRKRKVRASRRWRQRSAQGAQRPGARQEAHCNVLRAQHSQRHGGTQPKTEAVGFFRSTGRHRR